MVRALPHTATGEESWEHDSFIEGHSADLCLQFDKWLFGASKLSTAGNVFQLFIIDILYAWQLIRSLLLLVVQMLYRVYYLPQLNCKLLLANCYHVQLLNLLLILNVDSLLMHPYFCNVVAQGLTCSLEHLPHIRIYCSFYLTTHFLY